MTDSPPRRYIGGTYKDLVRLRRTMPNRKPLTGPKGASGDKNWARYRELFPRYFWSEETRLASIIVADAKGSMVRDTSGKTYIDLTSQWATNNLGNVPPEVLDVTVKALGRYGFLTYFMTPHLPMIELAERLLKHRPSANLSRVFLELSGTGAVEGAVKHAVEASKRPLILSFLGQYHGLSIGTSLIGSLSAHERRYWEAWGGGALHAPYPFPYRRPSGMSEGEYGDWVLNYIEDQILGRQAEPDRIAGVILEPIACEAGIWIPPASFVRGLAKLCGTHDWFFIDDEVETGLGRTGKMWAIEHFGVAPDLMAIGKGISGGMMPIAAVMGTEEVMGEAMVAAGTTFAGHPAACAAASKTLEIMERDRIPQRSARLGAVALKRMKEWERLPNVGEVRGLGLCLGIELVHDKRSKRAYAELGRRIFFDCVKNGTIPLWNYGDHVVRIEPPLTIEREELDAGLDAVEAALRRV
ncbi:MAG: aminotransferase class III-fold pyridoxal phosphate-dependent enzyme [Thermoplasmata archaeon]|nr:aminotransferase class III-fold pyridoxal phosphate-dependent enzyme [Thermoplasmata archaeon]